MSCAFSNLKHSSLVTTAARVDGPSNGSISRAIKSLGCLEHRQIVPHAGVLPRLHRLQQGHWHVRGKAPGHPVVPSFDLHLKDAHVLVKAVGVDQVARLQPLQL